MAVLPRRAYRPSNARAENDHKNRKDGGNGSDEADVVGPSLTAYETQSLARCTAERASSKTQRPTRRLAGR